MGCCGQKRAEWRAAMPMNTPARATLLSGPSVGVRCTEPLRAPLVVRGPVTARRYEFTTGRPVQPVDMRDAAGLMHTGRFVRA